MRGPEGFQLFSHFGDLLMCLLLDPQGDVLFKINDNLSGPL